MKKKYLITFFFTFFIFFNSSYASLNLEKGKKIFFNNCFACHQNGTNIIIPEKNLKIEALKANGMNKMDAIIYQVLNGKNGMPAFGGRLSEKEIEEVSIFVLKQSWDQEQK